VLLILVDDLNAMVGAMDGAPNIETPNIDRLARQGTLFTNAHANAPICAPSRASLYTGMMPHESGYLAPKNDWHNNPVLANRYTLPQYLRRNGYYTAAVGKVTHFDRPQHWDIFGPRTDYTPTAYNGSKAVVHPAIPAPFRNDRDYHRTFAPLSMVPSVAPQVTAPGYNGWWYREFRRPFRYVDADDRDPMPDELYARWAIRLLKLWENRAAAEAVFSQCRICAAAHSPGRAASLL
tara:strand:+ start:7876 stop:8583 length:708 start_codon:yes stop_codon:yes gene_type:complete